MAISRNNSQTETSVRPTPIPNRRRALNLPGFSVLVTPMSGDRPERATGWLWRQSVANEFPRRNSLFCGKLQGISAKTDVLGRQSLRKTVSTQGVSGQIPYAREQGIFSTGTGKLQGTSRELACAKPKERASRGTRGEADLHRVDFRCRGRCRQTCGKVFSSFISAAARGGKRQRAHFLPAARAPGAGVEWRHASPGSG